MLELFAFQGQEHVARDVLQEVPAPSQFHQQLKYLTRRRRQLVEERVLRKTRLQADLQAFVPGLLQITGSVGNRWFLRLLTCRDDIRELASLRTSTLKKIAGVGSVYADQIRAWQKVACFSPDIELAGRDLVVDARAILTLSADIRSLEQRIEQTLPESVQAGHLLSLPGFGTISAAELIGEIGSCERFRNESSLAYYIGMAPLDNSSGQRQRGRRATNINRACQRAMMIATVRHMSQVPLSRAFYDKKRQSGKRHNQAVRALGRHLTRVIWQMLTQLRDYVRPSDEKQKNA
jgi:transposase